MEERFAFGMRTEWGDARVADMVEAAIKLSRTATSGELNLFIAEQSERIGEKHSEVFDAPVRDAIREAMEIYYDCCDENLGHEIFEEIVERVAEEDQKGARVLDAVWEWLTEHLVGIRSRPEELIEEAANTIRNEIEMMRQAEEEDAARGNNVVPPVPPEP